MSVQDLTRDDIIAWLEDFHAHSAALDANAWLSRFFAKDVTMQYANWPTIKGYENVLAMFESVFPSLTKMTHRIREVQYVAPVIFQSADIEYLIKGDEGEGREIKIPGFMIAELVRDEDGTVKAKRLETYLDPTEIFQRIESVKAKNTTT